MTAVARTRNVKPFSIVQQRLLEIRAAEPVLTDRLREAFITFLENHPPKRFSPNLRSMTLKFILNGGTEAPYLKDLLLDLDGLFELLTIAETEWKVS